jgi:hypothetical protein
MKLIEATNMMDTSEVRTRAIDRELRNEQELPSNDLLNDSIMNDVKNSEHD